MKMQLGTVKLDALGQDNSAVLKHAIMNDTTVTFVFETGSIVSFENILQQP